MRSQSSKLAPLPAMNQPRTLKATVGGTKPIDGQQARLLRYSSRIADISQPYSLDHGMGGVSVNRKAASERANIKGKSDRATNEQVLDPRTRLILFKMIGRGLIFEVNGCISTGKEVTLTLELISHQC